MTKLLNDGFSRMKRDKALWLFLAGMLLMAVVVMLSNIGLNQKYPGDREFDRLDDFLFQSVPFIGFFCSAAVSMFLGKEYSEGTMRNKLIAGHTRTQVYLASFLLSVVIAELFAAACFLGTMIGVFHFGFWEMETGQLLLCLLVNALSSAALGSVFALLGMLITNRTASVVAAIFLCLGLLMLGSFLYNQLCEPETTYEYIMISESGIEYGNEVANPVYVGGALRQVYYALLNILPTGQGILLANLDDETVVAAPALELAGSLLIILLTSGAGLLVFRKKDLK